MNWKFVFKLYTKIWLGTEIRYDRIAIFLSFDWFIRYDLDLFIT